MPVRGKSHEARGSLCPDPAAATVTLCALSVCGYFGSSSSSSSRYERAVVWVATALFPSEEKLGPQECTDTLYSLTAIRTPPARPKKPSQTTQPSSLTLPSEPSCRPATCVRAQPEEGADSEGRFEKEERAVRGLAPTWNAGPLATFDRLNTLGA